MHSESVVESRAAMRGRRRKRGNEAPVVEGPVFVDTSGRRAKVLRRIGLLLGVACVGYAVLLGAAFMGWGTSLTPSSLLPFGAEGGSGPGGAPSGTPSGAPGTGLPPQGGNGAS
ncbi:hypothetical protein [Streptomyces sp. B93]|uniref:hypothetical protein n=1 Tax=Streptomyces sp. B93 TaxID=2824875 RepID=UPI001FFD0B6B|nr:hypothetical protein [Streptomyces sp. B93]